MKNLPNYYVFFSGFLFLLSTSAYAQTKDVAKISTVERAATKAAEVATQKATAQAISNAAKRMVMPSITRPNIAPLLPTDPLAVPDEGIISSNTGRIIPPELDAQAGIYKRSTVDDISIPERDRAEWVNLREKYSTLEQLNPNTNLAAYLKHPVPQKTFDYLKSEYKSLIESLEQFRQNVAPSIVYNSFPAQGRFPSPSEIGYINGIVYSAIVRTRDLASSLNYDLLKKYEEFFVDVFEAYNPSLTGTLRNYEVISRTDRTEAKSSEFFLMNPDGTDYVLPKSYSLADPEEAEEEESYAAVYERQHNPPITQEAAKEERTRLLQNIPTGLHIAFINDDLLPVINFGQWGKNGYLGTDAQVETFRDGREFMEKVRSGVHYNVVITDLLVPHGGMAMMPEFRKLDDNSIVIACSKFDREDQDAQKLLNLGFDGYLWYDSSLNEGMYGYIEYLRAMNNYFYYRDLYKWKR